MEKPHTNLVILHQAIFAPERLIAWLDLPKEGVTERDMRDFRTDLNKDLEFYITFENRLSSELGLSAEDAEKVALEAAFDKRLSTRCDSYTEVARKAYGGYCYKKFDKLMGENPKWSVGKDQPTTSVSSQNVEKTFGKDDIDYSI